MCKSFRSDIRELKQEYVSGKLKKAEKIFEQEGK